MQVAVGQGLLTSQNRLCYRRPELLGHQRRVIIAHSTCRSLKVAAALGGAKVEVSQVKADIVKLAGDKHGLDRTQEQREEIRQKVAELEKLDVVEDIDLTGTQWRTVYTTSTGNSSGKLGPFIGTVRQIFPSGDLAGKYFNNFQLGPFGVSLRGVYSKVNDRRLRVDFEFVNYKVGPFTLFRKDFEKGFGGHWDLKYVDPSFRIFYTNKNNVFVLQKVDDE